MEPLSISEWLKNPTGEPFGGAQGCRADQPLSDCWRVVRVERYVEAVDDETYDTADRAAAAAFAWRTRYPHSEFEIERA